jgi:putative peptide zinc metalloprotease protein
MSTYAKLRDDLVVSPTVIEGETVYNIKDPIKGTYFRLREPEYWLVNQLDGVTSYVQIADRFRSKFQLNISEENVLQFVQALEKLYFLDNARAEQAVSRTSYLIDKHGSLFSRLLFVKFKAFNPGKLLDRLTSIYRQFHNLYGFALQALLIVLGMWILLTNSDQFSVSLHSIFNLGSIMVVITAIFIFFIVHEFAHAVICRYYGGEVREMGFLLLYFQPAFYCDLSDAWLFGKKRHRLAVTAAGPYFQLILMAVATIMWRITVLGSGPNDLARIIVIISWVTLLVNLNPLIKLDGYYLLSDWVDIPNLRRKSFGYLGNVLKHRLLGWPVDAIEVSVRQRRIFLVYSVCAVLYTGVLLVWVLSVVAEFLMGIAGGLGLLLLIAFLFLTLRSSIVGLSRGVVKHIRFMKTLLRSPLRLAVHIILAVIVVVVMVAIPFPKRVTGEVAIRPIAECTLRLNKHGLLETEYRRRGANADRKTSFLQMTSTDLAALKLVRLVKDGQEVKAGDSVAVLASNQVANEIAAETSVLEKVESELALLMAPPKKEAVAEAEAQVTAARANYQQRDRDLQRIEELASKDLITHEELDTKRAEVAIAKAELVNKDASLQLLRSPPKPEEVAVLQAEIDRQMAKLGFLRSQQAAQTIRAPMSGRVDIRQADDEILSIVDDREVEILVPVSDFDVELIKLGQEVQLKVRSYPSEVFQGKVTHVPLSAEVVDNNAIFAVSVVVDNEEGRLRNGMTGYAKIECGRSSLVRKIIRKIASNVRVEFWSWW